MKVGRRQDCRGLCTPYAVDVTSTNTVTAQPIRITSSMSNAARACLLFVVALLALLGHVDSAPASALPPNLTSLTVKQLRAAIASRGLTCISCTEKQHLVDFLQEHIDVPTLGADAPTSSTGQSPSSQSTHYQKPPHPTREELLQQLRNQQPGFGAPKDESPAEAIMRRFVAAFPLAC